MGAFIIILRLLPDTRYMQLSIHVAMMNRIYALGSMVALGSLLVVVPSALAQIQLDGNLKVTVNALDSQEGAVCFKLFSGRQGFPSEDDSAVLKRCVPIEEVPLTVTFEDLPFGNYAVAVYHDENEDSIMNRNSFGMPSEGYGFSNDAPAMTGPAQFEDAMFVVAGPTTEIQLTMRYPE